MQITLIISLVFAVIIAIFAVANSEAVSINLIFVTYEMSQAIVILISSIIGAISVFLLNMVSKIKSSRNTKRLNNEIKSLKSQLKLYEDQIQEEKTIQNESTETPVTE